VISSTEKGSSIGSLSSLREVSTVHVFLILFLLHA
jgi:hypothetical protein